VASRKRVQSYTQKSSPPNFSQRKSHHQNQLLQQNIAIQHHITSKKISKKTPQALSIRFCPPDTDISPQNS
ncbi:hypothetical protein, partial [Paramuribaculum intestinale]|uniref:hypothetical protein n=1 Tax=Paramuribaculum intestinale TaxID=2094151 RepID=UPI0025B0393D